MDLVWVSAPEKGSKVNTQTLENCFGVIVSVEEDITSTNDMKLFFYGVLWETVKQLQLGVWSESCAASGLQTGFQFDLYSQ